MIVSNTDTVPGRTITAHLGMVTGSTVRARNIFIDIIQWFKALFGGELRGYSKLLTQVREQALARMQLQAKGLGANAVINVRFSTSTVSLGSAEIYAYGTAVVLSGDDFQFAPASGSTASESAYVPAADVTPATGDSGDGSGIS